MPKLYEVNTDNEVLCYIPSGKITDSGQQKIQFGQDGGTCWFYPIKRLAKATGFQFDDHKMLQRYELISTFRKTQSRLDAAVSIAALILVKNCPEENVSYAVSRCLKLNPNPWSRQLKHHEKDAQFIKDLIERYRNSNLPTTYSFDQLTIETIAAWCRARIPYQSQLLECACNTAEGLSKLGSDEFSEQWVQDAMRLISVASSSVSTDGRKELTVKEKQTQRTLALTEFNHKIRREALAVFKMEATTFETAMELKDVLKKHGPIIVSGYYGEAYYSTAPQPLKNAEGDPHVFGTRQLVGWSKEPADELDNLPAHQITIIGIKFNPEHPFCSEILFIDPKDSSLPGEHRKAYVMSFERLINNKITEDSSISAHYSTANNMSQEAYDREVMKKASDLLTYTMFAAVEAVSTIAASPDFVTHRSSLV